MRTGETAGASRCASPATTGWRVDVGRTGQCWLGARCEWPRGRTDSRVIVGRLQATARPLALIGVRNRRALPRLVLLRVQLLLRLELLLLPAL